MPKQNQRFHHNWDFMANGGSNGLGELGYCDLCRQWRFGTGKPFKMTQEEFRKMHQNGEIDATEVLGPREEIKDY